MERIEAGIHYCDLRRPVHRRCDSELDARAKDAGLTCVSASAHARDDERDGRLRCGKLNKVQKVPPPQHGAVSRRSPDLRSPYAIRTIFDEFSMDRPRPAERKDPVRPPALRHRAVRVSAARGRRRATTRSIRTGHHAEDRSERASRRWTSSSPSSGVPPDDRTIVRSPCERDRSWRREQKVRPMM